MLSISTQITKEDDIQAFEQMLDSVSFANEIRIYTFNCDDDALHKTVDKYHATCIPLKLPLPKIVEVIRARQVREAEGDWVLIMDYDEIVTPELKNEILKVTANPSNATAAYTIPRRNFSLGFPISHGGFGDDYVHRLFQRKYFLDWPTNIHSTPVVKGDVEQLDGYMEHRKDASLSQMVEKTNRYSDIEAEQFLDGELPPVTVVTLFRKPLMEFIRRYILKKGFLDGRIGLIQSLYQGYSVFVTYAKLYEKQQKGKIR